MPPDSLRMKPTSPAPQACAMESLRCQMVWENRDIFEWCIRCWKHLETILTTFNNHEKEGPDLLRPESGWNGAGGLISGLFVPYDSCREKSDDSPTGSWIIPARGPAVHSKLANGCPSHNWKIMENSR